MFLFSLWEFHIFWSSSFLAPPTRAPGPPLPFYAPNFIFSLSGVWLTLHKDASNVTPSKKSDFPSPSIYQLPTAPWVRGKTLSPHPLLRAGILSDLIMCRPCTCFHGVVCLYLHLPCVSGRHCFFEVICLPALLPHSSLRGGIQYRHPI